MDFEAVEAFNDTGKEYARLNTEQMYQGTNSKGQEIKPDYAPSTIARKKAKGQPFDRVTLNDTNEFYTKTIAFADNDKIYIDSDVPYTKYLVEHYGETIFGLDKDNRKEFTFGRYWSVLRRRVETISGLKFS